MKVAHVLAALVALVFLAHCTAHAAPLRYQHWRNALKPAGKPAHQLALSASGQTDYKIVIPSEQTSQEGKAAEELAHWLNEMTGAQFTVLPDSEDPGPCEISVGNTNRLALLSSGLSKADLGDDGYGIAVQGANVYIVGGKRRGIINGVFALLEEDLGCRWYAKDVTRIPHRPTVRVGIVPRIYLPPLMIRDPFYSDAFNGTWSLRNRTNAPSAAVPAEWGGHVTYALFVHTFNTLVPPGEYFDKNPELFMQNADGNRTARQLCLTNPETIRITTESCLRILRDKPEANIISVSKNDGGGSCVCENCKAIDDAEGTDAGSLIHFVNKVAEGIEKEFPEVTVSTLAYLETVQQPKTLRPRKNVAIRLCTDRCMWSKPFTRARESDVFSAAMEGWGAIHDNIHIWDYCVNFSHYLAPMPNMEVIADNIRYFVANNCTGVMEQGAYQSPGSEREWMRCWVFGKLLWDPSLDVNELMQDFIWGYYGKAAPAIAQYNALLQQQGRDYAESLAEPEGGIRYAMDSPFLSPEFLDRADELFAQALALAENDEIRRRVELEQLAIVYVKLMRGPAFVGEGYAALIDQFEEVARREKITHLREGGPDLDAKLKKWRDDLRVHAELQQVKNSDVQIFHLSNAWKFATDATEKGEASGWADPGFDDAAWATVRSDTETGWEHQGFTDYTGFGWYRQTVDVPKSAEAKHLYLYFEAVDEDAYVYVDGKLLCEHTCSSTKLSPDIIWLTPFAMDAAKVLKPGSTHTIAVRVLNRLGMGGVYKPVHMVASERELDAALIEALMEQ